MQFHGGHPYLMGKRNAQMAARRESRPKMDSRLSTSLTANLQRRCRRLSAPVDAEGPHCQRKALAVLSAVSRDLLAPVHEFNAQDLPPRSAIAQH